MADQGRQVFNGRYELRRTIARGGMAEVWLAHDALLDRPVALKVLFPEFATDPAFVERFRREAQSAANLSHPNIVNVYDWGEEGGTYFIVMEHVEGRSLAEIIRAEGPLHPDRAADVCADIAAALGFAHRNGVVHRDVKPANVLISPAGQVKVTDFGIARALQSADDALTRTGSVMGTATYFSPEQARGQGADPRSDVYSLGVVLYESLTGRPPFSGDSSVAIAYKHVQEAPTPPRRLNADMDEQLEAVVLTALAKDSADRYQSAEELRADLRRWRQGQPVLAAAPAALAGAAGAAGADATRMHRPVDATAAYAPPTTTERTVTATEQETPPTRRTSAYVVLLVVLLGVLAGLLFLLASTLGLIGGSSAAQVAVPRVVGLPEDQAVRTLTDEGFEVDQVFEANDRFEEGVVFAQDPEPGLRADEGSTVEITVSSGQPPVEVPGVVGDHVDDAVDALERAGLDPEIVREPSEDVPEDEVMAQEPDAGREIPRGSVVQLTVSSGPPRVPVPDVAGETESAAANELGRAGLATSVVREPSSTVAAGRVIRTEPGAGTPVRSGETVTIVVSSGPQEVSVPDVIDETRDRAEAILRDAGFAVRVVFRDLPPGHPDHNRVVDQDPAPGARTERGSTVTIFVGRAIGQTTSTSSTTTSSTTTTTGGG